MYEEILTAISLAAASIMSAYFLVLANRRRAKIIEEGKAKLPKIVVEETRLAREMSTVVVERIIKEIVEIKKDLATIKDELETISKKRKKRR